MTNDKVSKVASYIRLTDTLSKAQLNRYLKLAFFSHSLIRHDLGNKLTSFLGYATLVAGKIEEIQTILLGSDASIADKELINNNLRIIRTWVITCADSSFQYQRLLESYFNYYAPGLGVKNLLLTLPLDEFKRVQQNHPEVAIKMEPDSPKNVVIPFPGNVFYGILSELVLNAIKHSGNLPDIHVSWGISEEEFILLVRDNGEKLGENFPTSFIPFDEFERMIQKNSDALGLRLIHQLLYHVNGSISFSRSQAKGGLTVRVRIPVISYILDGKLFMNGRDDEGLK